MLRYVHNTQHEENKEEENPLTTHYTREKTYEKDDEKGTQVRSVRIVQRGGGGEGEVFPVSVHIYHHNCVLFL